MVNLAKKTVDDENLHLEDAEISRILSTLASAEFKKSEDRNARLDQTFKPRTLMEIAEAIEHQNRQTKNQSEDSNDTKDLQDANESRNETILEKDPPDNVSSQNEEVNGLRPITSNEVSSLENDLPENEEVSGLMPLTSKDVSEVADDKNELSEKDLSSEEGKPASPFETAKAAHQRGYEEGIIVGREAAEKELRASSKAEAEAKISEKMKVFESTLAGLVKPKSIDTKLLSESIKAAILRLAAARIGTVIDEFPERMIDRIESLADSAGKKLTSGQVFLNAEDFAVIAPAIKEFQEPLDIKESVDLNRGDIRIKFDGMEIEDLFTDRLAPTETVLPRNEASTEDPHDEIEEDFETSDGLGKEQKNNKDDQSDVAASLEEAAGLMPLTSKAVPDSAAGVSADVEEAAGLMPLTSKAVPDSAAGDSADVEEAAGLMPLTSKEVDAEADDISTEKSLEDGDKE